MAREKERRSLMMDTLCSIGMYHDVGDPVRAELGYGFCTIWVLAEARDLHNDDRRR